MKFQLLHPPILDESLPCRSVSSGSRLCRESPAQQLWSSTKGKKQCDSYFRQGRGGRTWCDVMLGSRFGSAEKPCASAHTGVWWMTPAATAGLVVTQANGNSRQLATWGAIGRRSHMGWLLGRSLKRGWLTAVTAPVGWCFGLVL